MTRVDELPAPARGQSDSRPKPRRFALARAFTSWRGRRRVVADRWLSRERLRSRMIVITVAVVVVAAGAGVWLVWFSPFLAVKDVRVVGLSTEAEVVGAQQLRATAEVPLAVPLMSADTVGAQQRVRDLPWVESVEVYRSWPDAIVIEVVERTPVAVLEQGQERRGVDATGVVFDPPGGLWLADPVIRGEEAALSEAVAVVASLPPEIEERVRVVQAVSPDDIRLQLGNDAIVRWGNAEEGEFKAQVLLSLLPRRAQAYDVSAPQLPTTFGEKGTRD